MVDKETLGGITLAVIVVVVFALIGIWWYVCYVAAGAILAYWGVVGEGAVALQIVLGVVIILLTGALGRIGMRTFQ